MSIYNIINTYPKCDLCFQLVNISDNNEINNVIKCENCLTLYHMKCEKKLYGRNFKGKKCFKCVSNEYNNDKCIVCGNQSGLMIKCDSTWVHIICLKSLNKFFILKSKNLYTLKTPNLLKEKKRCHICEKKTIYISYCTSCSITFHPYCAFKANFDIIEMKNEVIFPCGENHFMFHKEQFSSISNEESEDELHEGQENLNGKSKNNNIEVDEKESINIINSINKESKQKYLDKEEKVRPLNTIDMKFLKHKLIKLGVYNQFAKNSISFSQSNKLIFDWRQMLSYFTEFSKEERQNIFPIEYKNYKTLRSEEEREYKMCTIVKKNNLYYVIYDTTNISVKDISKKEKEKISPSYKPFHFINRKRFLYRRKHKNSSDYIKLEKDNIKFLRGFKINSLSNKILTLEKIASLTNDTAILKKKKFENFDFSSFVDSEIKIKEIMLDRISKINSLVIEKLQKRIEKEHLNLNKNAYFYTDNLPLHKLSSQYNYLNIIKRLTAGVLPKEKITTTIEEGLCECCICFNNTIETFSPIVYCDGCNVGVHQSCYGIKRIPEKEYLCDLCVAKGKNVKCVLCNGTMGAMKKFNKANWGHVTCILLSDYVMFTDYALMDKFEILQQVKFDHFCFLCNRPGEVIKCKKCDKFYHFFCAYFKGFYLNINTIEDNRYPGGKKCYVKLKCCVCGEENGEWKVVDREKQKLIRNAIFQKNELV